MFKKSVSIFTKIDQEKLNLGKGKLAHFFTSEVKLFTTSAYIPISKKYKNHEVLVVVFEKRVKKC